ncbi:MAG: hypothetical protein SF029_01355 [bacterium]|nr:hypothetical protein [bacterium]
MPIHSMNFSNGIFFAVEEGMVSEAEAREWMRQLTAYATVHSTPIVAIVDANAVSLVSSEASKVFIRASQIYNVSAIIVATKDPFVRQIASSIGIRGRQGGTHVFSTMAEARQLAEELLNR